MKIFLIFVLFMHSSCAYFKIINLKKSESKKLKSPFKYEFVDTTGTYLKHKDQGVDKNSNVVVKSKLYVTGKKNQPVERLISISKKGKTLKNIKILEPEKSEVVYWFDGKKYKSTISLDPGKKQFIVRSISQDKQWNKVKKVKARFGKKAYCFFSQLVECVSHAGFFELSREKRSGAMNLEIVWDGHPFFNEQFLNDKENLISTAKISFVKKEAQDIYKYQLSVDGQVLHYFIYQDHLLAKMFWVSQGISQTLME